MSQDHPDGPRGMQALLREAVRTALSDHPAMLAAGADRARPAGTPTRDSNLFTSALAGVLYAEDFDAPETEPEAEPPPPPEPIHTARDVALAREAGHDEGMKAARASAQAEAERERLVTLHAVAEALTGARDMAEEFAAEAAEAVARLVLALLAAALPATCARHGERELRALVQAVLPALETEPRITIRANPQRLGGLGTDVARLDPDLAARVELLPAALAPDEVRITWQDGRAGRDHGAIHAALETVLGPLGLYETPHPAKEMAHAG